MTPMTPFIENRTGRLTELVYLLSDRPLALAHQAVLDAEDEEPAAEDPWYLVASALYRLQEMTESSLHSRYLQRELAAANALHAKLLAEPETASILVSTA